MPLLPNTTKPPFRLVLLWVAGLMSTLSVLSRRLESEVRWPPPNTVDRAFPRLAGTERGPKVWAVASADVSIIH